MPLNLVVAYARYAFSTEVMNWCDDDDDDDDYDASAADTNCRPCCCCYLLSI